MSAEATQNDMLIPCGNTFLHFLLQETVFC